MTNALRARTHGAVTKSCRRYAASRHFPLRPAAPPANCKAAASRLRSRRSMALVPPQISALEFRNSLSSHRGRVPSLKGLGFQERRIPTALLRFTRAKEAARNRKSRSSG
jgi:hypothetical protein